MEDEKEYKTLRQRLITELKVPEENISSYQSDLLILYTEEVNDWLKANFEYPQNIITYLGNVEGSDWYLKKIIEVPFAYEEFYEEKKFHKGER